MSLDTKFLFQFQLFAKLQLTRSEKLIWKYVRGFHQVNPYIAVLISFEEKIRAATKIQSGVFARVHFYSNQLVGFHLHENEPKMNC